MTTVTSATGELGDLTHGAAFLLGLIFGVWLTMRIFRAVREQFRQDVDDT
jgi:uncharacterized protein YneF (UPF0154 family)